MCVRAPSSFAICREFPRAKPIDKQQYHTASSAISSLIEFLFCFVSFYFVGISRSGFSAIAVILQSIKMKSLFLHSFTSSFVLKNESE